MSYLPLLIEKIQEKFQIKSQERDLLVGEVTLRLASSITIKIYEEYGICRIEQYRATVRTLELNDINLIDTMIYIIETLLGSKLH